MLTAGGHDIHANLSTVALLPVNAAVPLAAFAAELCTALNIIGTHTHTCIDICRYPF